MEIFSLESDETGITLSWYSVGNETYGIETSTNLVNWDDIEDIAAPGLTATYTDTDSERLSASSRFYRIRQE
jgi:hypothetical protein